MRAGLGVAALGFGVAAYHRRRTVCNEGMRAIFFLLPRAAMPKENGSCMWFQIEEGNSGHVEVGEDHRRGRGGISARERTQTHQQSDSLVSASFGSFSSCFHNVVPNTQCSATHSVVVPVWCGAKHAVWCHTHQTKRVAPSTFWCQVRRVVLSNVSCPG